MCKRQINVLDEARDDMCLKELTCSSLEKAKRFRYFSSNTVSVRSANVQLPTSSKQ